MIQYEDITPGYYWARRTPYPNEDLIIYVHGEKPFYKMQLRLSGELLDVTELNFPVIFLCRIPSIQEDHIVDKDGYIRKP